MPARADIHVLKEEDGMYGVILDNQQVAEIYSAGIGGADIDAGPWHVATAGEDHEILATSGSFDEAVAYARDYFSDPAYKPENAGCDSCGADDRMEGSKFCSDCQPRWIVTVVETSRYERTRSFAADTEEDARVLANADAGWHDWDTTDAFDEIHIESIEEE